MNGECDIREGFRAAGVNNNVVLDLNADQVPLTIGHIVGQVHLRRPVDHADLHTSSTVYVYDVILITFATHVISRTYIYI